MGPGYYLSTKLPQIFKCKACRELAAKMDDGGPDWCEEHREEIVEEITDRAGSYLPYFPQWLERKVAEEIDGRLTWAIDQAQQASQRKPS